MNLTDAEYKKFIEARVSNQKGTTLAEVVLVTLGGVAASAVSSRVFHALSARGASTALARAAEFALLVVPLLLLATSASPDVSAMLAAAFAVPLVAMSFFMPSSTSAAAVSSTLDTGLALLKGSLMMQTVVAILAVDFAPFPGRFMKTETFGVSLMDVGVGAFVFTAALSRAAGQVRRQQQEPTLTAAVSKPRVTKSKSKSKKAAAVSASPARSLSRAADADSNRPCCPFSLQFVLGPLRRSNLMSCVPLLVLGFARLAAVKSSDYQEHVSEYGVHWNFFFTLGALPIVVAIAHGFVGAVIGEHASLLLVGLLDLVAGALLLAGHQFLLTGPPALTDYVMSPHRRTLVEANKEGLVSSLGYGALFLLSSSCYVLFLSSSLSGSDNGKSKTKKESGLFNNKALRAAALGALLVAASFALERSVQPVSRRLCNATYVVVCIGIGFIAYSMCALATSALGGAATSKKKQQQQRQMKDALTCVTENQLFLFLVANIGTGIVNNSMRTVFASTWTAYIILAVYVTVVLVVGTQLSAAGVRIKI